MINNTLDTFRCEVLELPNHFLSVINKLNRKGLKPIQHIVLYMTIPDSDVELLNITHLNAIFYIKDYETEDYSLYDQYYDLYQKACSLFKLPHYGLINHLSIKNMDELEQT